MDNDERLIENFFTAFKNLDAVNMNACYSSDIAFYDPMFELLRGDEARAMWTMLCKNAKNFSLEFDNIKNIGEGYYTCNWQASYDFSKTGRRVVNNIKAHLKIENGFITEHSDAWSLHKWSQQALGFSGWLLGWNSFFRKKLQNGARKNLLAFMEKN